MSLHGSDKAALLFEHSQDADLKVMTEADIDEVAGSLS
jgi:hypothetical protein